MFILSWTDDGYLITAIQKIDWLEGGIFECRIDEFEQGINTIIDALNVLRVTVVEYFESHPGGVGPLLDSDNCYDGVPEINFFGIEKLDDTVGISAWDYGHGFDGENVLYPLPYPICSLDQADILIDAMIEELRGYIPRLEG